MSTSSPQARQARLPLRARLAATVGGVAGTASRLAGRGDGSVIGGVIGLKLQPDLLSLLATGRQVILVTGTNGKTTTTRLITAALGTLGQQIASNAFGANMEAGMVSALAKAPDASIAVLEVDEKHIPAMLRKTSARVVVLLNLSRDQMDRAAEIWLLARRWREALAAVPDCRVIANADDPLVAWAAGEARLVTWVAAGQRWHDDSWCCPSCGAHLRREGDDWHCLECSYRRPPVRWLLLDDQVLDPAGRSRTLDLVLPGRANRSNAVMALAVAEEFGISVAQALPAIAQVRSVAGRYTQVSRRGCELRLLLAKNPAGWLEALDVLAPGDPVLLAVNAQGPDGRDTSWLWDVDYRGLRGRPVFVTGERRTDLAVRLEADEVMFRIVGSVDEAIDLASSPSLEVIANYTAFQHIRAVVGRTV
ncbi:MAG TPA: MurT ligase domain-containing protein [Streptosporangiaceae bacterium]|nr:MurT ligase domain-containing protein [Streptosporangiaceae bacterium]